MRLVGREPLPALGVADPQRLHQAPRLEVRAGRVEDLAVAHEIVERPQHLLERRLMVDMMDVVEVEVVGLQPLQRAFDLLLDVQSRHTGIVGPPAHRIEELGGDDGVLALTLQRDTQHRFRGAADIGIGRVEEVHARIERGVHHLRRTLLVGAIAEGHRAQADLGDFQAGTAEVAVVHGAAPREVRAIVPQMTDAVDGKAG